MLTPTPSLIWCSVAKVSTILPKAPLTPYTKSMNKQPDLAAIMASYTQQHNAMMARSAANRKAFAEGRPFPFPAPECQSTTWHISDRD